MSRKKLIRHITHSAALAAELRHGIATRPDSNPAVLAAAARYVADLEADIVALAYKLAVLAAE
jgi:hypothetical protein